MRLVWLARLPAVAAVAAVAAAALAAPAAADGCLPGLSAASSGQGGIVVRWEPVNANVTGYQVLLRPLGGEWYPVQPQSPPDATSYTDLGAPADFAYEYLVIAMAGDSQVAMFCPATGTSTTSFQPMITPGTSASIPSIWAVGAAIAVTAVATVVLVLRRK